MEKSKVNKIVNIVLIISFSVLLVGRLLYGKFEEKKHKQMEEKYTVTFSESKQLLNKEKFDEAQKKLEEAKQFSESHDKEIKVMQQDISQLCNSKTNYEKALKDIKKNDLNSAILCLNMVKEKDGKRYKHAQKLKEDYVKNMLSKGKELYKKGKLDEAYNLVERASTLAGDERLTNLSYEILHKMYPEDNKTKKEETINLTSMDGNLELIKYGSENGYIVGTIKNNSNQSYRYVQVNISLYDKSNNQVDSTITNIQNLEPYKSWNFKAVVIDENVASFRVVSIDAR